MAEFNPQCAEKPLNYGIGAGVFVRGIMKHVKVPQDFPIIGGLMSAPDYNTGYQAIRSQSSTEAFSSLFPPEMCAADLCEGELPGCPPPHIVAVEIPRVIFKMSRPFHWAPDTPVSLREFIAYGFAVLPEVLDVVARNLHANKTTTTVAPPPVLPKPRRLEEVQEGETFDEIQVEFSDLQYTIDQQLIVNLIRNRAFDLVTDGHKRELGPIKFIDFSLESKIPVDEDEQMQMSESVAVGTWSPFVIAGVSALCLAMLSLAAVRGVRKTPEDPEELEGGELSRDVSVDSEGYEPVSLHA